MKKLVIVLIALLPASAFAQTIKLDLRSAPQALSLMEPLSTGMNERDFAISPDGKEIYYTIASPRSDFQTIVFCRQVKPGEWSAPEVVSFAGNYSDLEPAFSADGNTLYFASNRPVEGAETKDFDIWKVSRDGTGWGIPVNLGKPVNTNADEFYPSLTKAGHLYFTASYAGQGRGREDIYKAEWNSSQYLTPQPLDSAINSKHDEFNAFVSPDEQYILFTCYGRRDDAGGGDLYISTKSNGQWQPAKALVEVNTKYLEYCPFVSTDGKKLFVTSTRYIPIKSFTKERATYRAMEGLWNNALNTQGNIYWMDFETLRKRYN